MTHSIMVEEFNWQHELEKTVVNSLITSFGLDFLLAEDKLGGGVDTVHNVREGVWATDKEKSKYDNREKYDSHAYHSDHRYIQKGRDDKKAQEQGTLEDAYREGKKIENKKGERQLDHTIAGKEISDDAGRVLAELNGVDLANQDSNLNSTHWYVNNLKRDHSVDKFVNEVIPKKAQELEQSICKLENQIHNMPTNTAEERHRKDQVQAKLQKEKEKKEALDDVLSNKDKILEADKKAREEYNEQINWSYYTSSKFFKATAKDMHQKGLAMGTRQALGLILSEVWFELREQIPKIYQKHKHIFDFNLFLQDILEAFKNIWKRIEIRFKDLLIIFKDSYIGGALASLNSTFLNMFFTTQKLIGKMIRELWNSLIGIIKLIVFNPNKLAMGDLMREVFKLLSLGVSTVIGATLHSYLSTILTIPFGVEIASFISALVTGIVNLGFVFFLEHSSIAQKFWNFLNQFKVKPGIQISIEKMKEVNLELDRYLTELTKIEFNLNPQELEAFSNSLAISSNEFERNFILTQEIKRRNIDLPYQAGNFESIRSFLKSKCKN